MTTECALAPNFAPSPVARALARRSVARAANDNLTAEMAKGNDELLREALRHFARYGLGAAKEARMQAEAAFFAGDRAKYDRWLGICRTLDRRMAEELARTRD